MGFLGFFSFCRFFVFLHAILLYKHKSFSSPHFFSLPRAHAIQYPAPSPSAHLTSPARHRFTGDCGGDQAAVHQGAPDRHLTTALKRTSHSASGAHPWHGPRASTHRKGDRGEHGWDTSSPPPLPVPAPESDPAHTTRCSASGAHPCHGPRASTHGKGDRGEHGWDTSSPPLRLPLRKAGSACDAHHRLSVVHIVQCIQ